MTPQEQLQKQLKEGRQLCAGIACMAGLGLILIGERYLPLWGVLLPLCSILTGLLIWFIYRETRK